MEPQCQDQLVLQALAELQSLNFRRLTREGLWALPELEGWHPPGHREEELEPGAWASWSGMSSGGGLNASFGGQRLFRAGAAPSHPELYLLLLYPISLGDPKLRGLFLARPLLLLGSLPFQIRPRTFRDLLRSLGTWP